MKAARGLDRLSGTGDAHRALQPPIRDWQETATEGNKRSPMTDKNALARSARCGTQKDGRQKGRRKGACTLSVREPIAATAHHRHQTNTSANIDDLFIEKLWKFNYQYDSSSSAKCWDKFPGLPDSRDKSCQKQVQRP